MPTFDIPSSFTPTSTRKFRILSTKFGDGYEQRGLDGIHTDLQVWALTFSPITVAEADSIEAFLVALGGTQSFDWVPPRSVTSAKFVCKTWVRSMLSPAADSVTATFEEVAEP